ncbi:MAG: NTP transferase domain-containing protein, partial [Arenibacter sp.]|nr:NTP transferase domain-containing protein [Arenibacter sp.]
MKIVILAAGIGSRLGNPFPKPLTPLKNGKCIMEMQVDNLDETFNIDDINVVVGFKKNLIMERFPELTYIYNPFFDQTNTSKSLLKALRKNRDKSVLWLNGDVVFDAGLLSVLKPFIDKKESFVAVNTSKVAEEEVKYTLQNGY